MSRFGEALLKRPLQVGTYSAMDWREAILFAAVPGFAFGNYELSGVCVATITLFGLMRLTAVVLICAAAAGWGGAAYYVTQFALAYDTILGKRLSDGVPVVLGCAAAFTVLKLRIRTYDPADIPGSRSRLRVVSIAEIITSLLRKTIERPVQPSEQPEARATEETKTNASAQETQQKLRAGFFSRIFTHKPRTKPVVTDRMDENEAFSILELPADAPVEEIKRKYRELMKVYHPDAVGNEKIARKAEYQDRYIKISSAYQTLISRVGVKSGE